MAKARTYTPSDVGCYADGSRGIYLTDFVVEFANDHGASIEHVCPESRSCRSYNLTNEEYDSFSNCESSSEYGDEATNYMNEHYPVEGCSWAFIDGDWGLWTNVEEYDAASVAEDAMWSRCYSYPEGD